MNTRRRLNLLVFPAETDALFALLMLAGVMLAIFLGNVIVNFWNSSFTSIELSLDTEAILASFLPIICVSGVMTGIIFGTAYIYYRRHPARLRRRKNLIPLAEKDQPLQQTIYQLASQVGVSPAPAVEMPQGLQGASGQAFGVGGRYVLRLDGGLRVLRRTKPDLFRAVVFHELAHIANRDVWRSYFSDALWRAILICSLLPLILLIGGRFVWNSLSSLLEGDLLSYLLQATPEVVKIFFQSVLTIAIVTLVWSRLLRMREFYADWQAARWGADGALKRIFRETAERETTPRRFNLRRLHPSAGERLALLDQPRNLMRISKVLTFVVGFLTPFILLGAFFAGFSAFLILQAPLRMLRETSEGLLFWLARGAWFLLFFAFLIAAFAPLAWLVSGVLGTQVQKQAARDLVEGRRGIAAYLRLGVPALLMVIGVEVGSWVIPLDLLSPSGLAALAIRFLLWIPMVFLAWWFLIYIRFLAIRLFIGYSGDRRPVWRMRSITWASVIWLFLFFLPGLILIQLLTNSTVGEPVFEYTGYAILGWLSFTLVFSPLYLAASWAAITVLSLLPSHRCPACGQVTRRSSPALETCEHCGQNLGEWLFVAEDHSPPNEPLCP